ncbi:hypothetical protein [Burkholderia ubonensis]|uniref:hypothetical protein n=1 Tax=Burkholderia ubonensis TaxID=101571 RepID=UPI0012F77322|nr:hypothetical protein [Burkholderia ubonensis]
MQLMHPRYATPTLQGNDDSILAMPANHPLESHQITQIKTKIQRLRQTISSRNPTLATNTPIIGQFSSKSPELEPQYQNDPTEATNLNHAPHETCRFILVAFVF